MTSGGGIEEILWNIFTYYTLNSNPRDPSKIHCMALTKLCKEVSLLDSSMTEIPLTQADIQLIYTSATVKNSTKKSAEKVDRLDFQSFLSCLVKISQKCYPSAGKSLTYNNSSSSSPQKKASNKEACFQFLMLEHLLPLASRRNPLKLTVLLKNPTVELLYKYFEESLKEIFRFYCQGELPSASGTLNHKNSMKFLSSDQRDGIFDKKLTKLNDLKNNSGMTQREREIELLEEEEAKNRELRKQNDHCIKATKLGYSDFLRFANDFGILTNLGLTTLDIGDIFLTVTQFTNFTPVVRRADFREFWEMIVRISLLAFQDRKGLNSESKIKALMLSIWRHMQSSVKEQVKSKSSTFNNYSGALLRGTQLFNDKFVSFWTKDNYKDYGTVEQCNINALSPSKSAPPLPSFFTGTSSQSSTTVNNSNEYDLEEEETQKIIKKDILTDEMLQISTKNIYDSENFLVKMPKGSIVRLKISDSDDFGDEKNIVTPKRLRKLLHDKPHLIEILYEVMLEENIVNFSSISYYDDLNDDEFSNQFNTELDLDHEDEDVEGITPSDSNHDLFEDFEMNVDEINDD